MKVAAIQMKADLANVEANLTKAKGLAEDAFRDGAECVILPEFFTSAVGFNRKMLKASLPLHGPAMDMLVSRAKAYDAMVGGSYLAWHGKDSYNTFILAMPDGTTYFHNKDLPTMWENCYYIGGSDDGILETPSLNVGVALCWEFIRSQTARRLINKIDLVVGGSCWWTLPKKRLPGFPEKLHDSNVKVMKETIPRFAKMMGVPVVHAAHAGDVDCGLPLLPGFPYQSYFLGETQIVDGTGKQLAHMGREDGDGFVIADIDLEKKHPPSVAIPERFWVPNLPLQFRLIWAYQNWHGKRYYQKKTRPVIVKQLGT